MVAGLILWILLLHINICLLNNDTKLLKKQVLELRSKIRRREAGQSWSQIARADLEKSVNKYLEGIDDT